MLADEHLDLPDELGVAAEREVGLEPPLERPQAELLESENLRLRNDSGRGRRAAARARGSRASRSRRAASSGAARLRLLDQRLEAEQVELVRADADQVTRLLRDDRLVRSERLAEL